MNDLRRADELSGKLIEPNFARPYGAGIDRGQLALRWFGRGLGLAFAVLVFWLVADGPIVR